MTKEIIIILLLLALLYYYHLSQTKFSAIEKLSDDLNEELEALKPKMDELLKQDKELHSYLDKERQDYETEIYQVKKEHQEQLRAINLLFDENAKDYKTIDFNGLYNLLKEIAEKHD